MNLSEHKMRGVAAILPGINCFSLGPKHTPKVTDYNVLQHSQQGCAKDFTPDPYLFDQCYQNRPGFGFL
jgi:hypothetical protein